MQNTHPFKRLVVYGCSFTAGSELIDHEMIGKSREWTDNYKRKHGLDAWFKFLQDVLKEKYPMLSELEKQRSWAGHLAKMLEIPCINQAVSGSSHEAMIYYYEQDKKTLLQPTDLIIFGLTSPGRFMRIDDYGTPWHHILGFDGPAWPSKKIHKNYVSLMGNDNTTVWQAYRDIQYISNLCRLNSNTFIQNIWADWDMYKGLFLKTTSQDVFNLIETNEWSEIASKSSIWQGIDYNDKSCQHGLGHPFECYHIQFAEILYNKIIGWYKK